MFDIDDPNNYPSELTHCHAACILDRVFVADKRPRCVNHLGTCRYHPSPDMKAQGMVGCAIAVLTPPHLRPLLLEGDDLTPNISRHPALAAYFAHFKPALLRAIQKVHDGSLAPGSLPGRMGALATILKSLD